MENILVNMLICPQGNETLLLENNELKSKSTSYKIESEYNIPLFANDLICEDSKLQQLHFDRVAKNYIKNLGYPHTKEYIHYLDSNLLKLIPEGSLGNVAEICCGTGEAFDLIKERVDGGIGVDISLEMLKVARKKHENAKFYFVQGDATNLPLKDDSFDNLFMLGGIHHINDRKKLFKEAYRILKPGGCFYFREPVSDFFIWKALRYIIYRVSSALDHKTERPLRYKETVPILREVGFIQKHWTTHGFFGFCIFMNSDILIFNRLFQYIPFIRAITKMSTVIDELILKIPGFSKKGLQVIGVAQKPY